MVFSVTYPILGHMLGCTNDEQLHYETSRVIVSPHHTWCSSVLTNALASVCSIALWGVTQMD